MAEQITITVPDGTTRKIKTVGTSMNGLSAESVVKELAMAVSIIPQNGGVRLFRGEIDKFLLRMGVGPEQRQEVCWGHGA